MRGFGSGWWHAPLLIVAITFIGPVAYVLVPALWVFGLGVVASVSLTLLLVMRDRQVYLPRRLEAQRAGSTRRPDIQWAYGTLVFCAFMALLQIRPHHHNRVGDALNWTGLAGMSGCAIWQLLRERRPRPR